MKTCGNKAVSKQNPLTVVYGRSVIQVELNPKCGNWYASQNVQVVYVREPLQYPAHPPGGAAITQRTVVLYRRNKGTVTAAVIESGCKVTMLYPGEQVQAAV